MCWNFQKEIWIRWKASYTLRIPLCVLRTGFGPNQTYCGDGIGTIKPMIFREVSGFLGIVFRHTYEPTLRIIIGPSKLAFLRTLPLLSGSKPSIGGSKILRVSWVLLLPQVHSLFLLESKHRIEPPNLMGHSIQTFTKPIHVSNLETIMFIPQKVLIIIIDALNLNRKAGFQSPVFISNAWICTVCCRYVPHVHRPWRRSTWMWRGSRFVEFGFEVSDGFSRDNCMGRSLDVGPVTHQLLCFLCFGS